MKNKIIIFSILILTFFACSKNTFKVDVELTNANGKTIYLQRIIDNHIVNLDSAVIKNNKAEFNVKLNNNNDAYHIFVDGWKRNLPFFSDNNDVKINGDFNSQHKINRTASQTQNLLNEYIRKINTIDDNDKAGFITEIVKNTPRSELTTYIVYKYKWAFDLKELKNIIKTYPRDYNSSYYKKLNEYINMIEKTEPGNKYIDIVLDNTEGQTVSLSSIVENNKLVLLDFWASWCPDCRVENPNIVEIYNEFKDKGLEIVSVSLDTDKDAWIKGIEEDNLSWNNHLSDLKGWNCVPASKYGVAFIPQNFLISSDGIIVAKNLNGDDLKLMIAKKLR